LNWEAIGAVGEILGALAVVITLAFLAVQVRQNSRSIRMSTRARATETFSNALSMMQQPGMAELGLSGLQDFQALNPADQLRFASHSLRMWRVIEDIYFQWREGDLDDDAWAEHRLYLLDTLLIPSNREVFNQRKQWLDPRFVEYVELELAGHDREVTLDYLNRASEIEDRGT
jgi:hypothetical protein